MIRKKIEDFLANDAENIQRMILIMCGINILDDTYTFKIEHQFGGGSWCSIDTIKHSVLIHIGMPEWFDDDYEKRDEYVKELGHEPNEKDMFIFYMALGMHEFMHACITRVGTHIRQLAGTFKMRNSSASKYQQEYFKQRVEQMLHLMHNAVCDARIENIGKSMFNVEMYFDAMRILDYLVAKEPSKSKFWNFIYALLQLGVIGKYPQFEIDPEAKVAIEALRNRPVVGSTHTEDLYAKFLCEPHPTISIKQFVKWFDVPEVRAYVEKCIYEEVETQCPAAEELAKKLAQMAKEVRISGPQAGNSGIPLNIPGGGIQVKTASGSSDEKKDGKDGEGSGKGTKTDDKNAKDKKSGGESGKKSDEKDGTGSNVGKDGEEKKESGETANGESNDGDSKTNSSKSKAQISNQPCGNESSMDDHDTFDENGEWSLSQSDDSGNSEAPLDENQDLRDALDKAIADLYKTAKSVNTKKEKNNNRKPTKPAQASEASVVIDTSFVADMFPPANIVRAAQPLRKVIKNLFSEFAEEDIKGLYSGTFDISSPSLCRLKSRETTVFKERRIPTVVDAVYYICWDGSGSMCGTKQTESAYACAVIEEAIRGIYPMKIVNFSTHGSVVHYVVKEFDDKGKKNCAYSFGAKRSFSGGNKDGYSIRQCAEELAKRGETNKFLIVLSDGAPSDYGSHKEAVEDVKSAVDWARSKKIDVTSIFFGSQYERDSQIDLYNEMYGTGHIISCDPSDIVSHMVKIVKGNVMKK